MSRSLDNTMNERTGRATTIRSAPSLGPGIVAGRAGVGGVGGVKRVRMVEGTLSTVTGVVTAESVEEGPSVEAGGCSATVEVRAVGDDGVTVCRGTPPRPPKESRRSRVYPSRDDIMALGEGEWFELAGGVVKLSTLRRRAGDASRAMSQRGSTVRYRAWVKDERGTMVVARV